MRIILTGTEAKEKLKALLETEEYGAYGIGKKDQVAGYYQEGEVYAAFDNTTNNCWTEEFSTEENAIKFCNGEQVEDSHGNIVG